MQRTGKEKALRNDQRYVLVWTFAYATYQFDWDLDVPSSLLYVTGDILSTVLCNPLSHWTGGFGRPPFHGIICDDIFIPVQGMAELPFALLRFLSA